MTTEQKIIRHKVGLLKLAEELGNVSKACKVMGYSRDTFYRYRPRWAWSAEPCAAVSQGGKRLGISRRTLGRKLG